MNGTWVWRQIVPLCRFSTVSAPDTAGRVMGNLRAQWDCTPITSPSPMRLSDHLYSWTVSSRYTMLTLKTEAEISFETSVSQHKRPDCTETMFIALPSVRICCKHLHIAEIRHCTHISHYMNFIEFEDSERNSFIAASYIRICPPTIRAENICPFHEPSVKYIHLIYIYIYIYIYMLNCYRPHLRLWRLQHFGVWHRLVWQMVLRD
jgi:hypothetical protein